MNFGPRVLCKPCNNDWGSVLESRVKPILQPMVAGEATTLSLPDMTMLCAWLTLKMIVIDHVTQTTGLFFSDEQVRYLRRKTRAPADTFVWLGRYVGRSRDACRVHNFDLHLHARDDTSVSFLGFVVTYAIGQAVFQAFSLQPNEDLRGFDGIRVPHSIGGFRTALIPIWPLPDTFATWPPPKALDDKGMHHLQSRWDPK